VPAGCYLDFGRATLILGFDFVAAVTDLAGFEVVALDSRFALLLRCAVSGLATEDWVLSSTE